MDWEIDVAKIDNMTKALIENTRKRCNEIIKSPTNGLNILKDLNDLERLFGNDACYINIVNSVHPSKEIRDKCTESKKELDKLSIEINMNKELYDTLAATDKELKNTELDAETRRYLEKSILKRKLNGLHLDETTRDTVKDIQEKISKLAIEFGKNCNEESTKFNFTSEQLAGVNENLLKSLTKTENGEYVLSLKYPVYFPVMKECVVPETRKTLNIAFDRRCVNENTKIFEEILGLRIKLAETLGYKNFSEYTLANLCAKNPETVEQFLKRLTEKLKVLQASEMQKLLEYKKAHCEEMKYTFDGKMNPSDMKFYQNMREQKEFNVDHSKIQEYFPINVVIDGTFKIYQTLLGLTFEEVPGQKMYHEEVKLFSVTDNETKQIIGHFYFDLHPRDGKYGHAAVFGIQKGCLKGGQRPVCMMVCNFTKPTEEKPSLFTHDEVETFFHEFGHVMHQINTKAHYYMFGGTSVERDFVEAPSQMLENWCWKKESLKMLSSHYKDSSVLPDKLIDDLIKSKDSANGIFNMRQLLFASMDQLFHTSPKVCDTADVYKKFTKEFMMLDHEAEGLNMNASFAHLTGGYQAQYYSYLWSEVYSQDMFETRFNKEGILNPKTGLDYRRCILEPGGSIDATEMVKNFLGREPNEEAFLKSKGIQA